jgi:hypothetical protein
MKIYFFPFLFLHCLFATAQIVSHPLSCGKHFLGFEFDVHFKGDSVLVSYKDETYTLPYNRSWITTHGEHWSDYTNGQIIVASSYPDEPYVAISLKNQKNAMASCEVVESQGRGLPKSAN